MVSKFLKKVNTRIVMRYDAATHTDKWGLAHGTIKQLVRDDLQNLIACKVTLDEGITLTITPTKLNEERKDDDYIR